MAAQSPRTALVNARGFWSRVDQSRGADGCWPWTAYVNPDGYGVAVVARFANRRAHRVAYELVVGPIPAGYEIDHRCLNRACCNPAHLEALPAAAHKARLPRGVQHWRAGRTTCPYGHIYDRYEYGQRKCSECVKRTQRESQRRRRAARQAAAA
jgi:hypothetical protein